MFAYYLIFVLSILLYIAGKNRFVYWASFIILVLLAGLRTNSVGGDTEIYVYAYSNDIVQNDLFNQNVSKPWEFLYYYWSKIIHLVTGGNIRLFLIFTAILTYFPVFYILKKNFKYGFRCTAFYILHYHYLMSYCFIMQYIAITIILCGFIYYCKYHKLNSLILFILLASFFHFSSLYILFMIPFINNKIKIHYYALVVIFSYFIGRMGVFALFINNLGFSSLYDGGYEIIAKSRFTLNGIFLSFFVAFSILVTNINIEFKKLYAIGMILLNILSFNTDISRISWDFSIFGIIILACTTLNYSDKNIKSFYKVCSILISILMYFNFLFADQGALGIYDWTLYP